MSSLLKKHQIIRTAKDKNPANIIKYSTAFVCASESNKWAFSLDVGSVLLTFLRTYWDKWLL